MMMQRLGACFTPEMVLRSTRGAAVLANATNSPFRGSEQLAHCLHETSGGRSGLVCPTLHHPGAGVWLPWAWPSWETPLPRWQHLGPMAASVNPIACARRSAPKIHRWTPHPSGNLPGRRSGDWENGTGDAWRHERPLCLSIARLAGHGLESWYQV